MIYQKNFIRGMMDGSLTTLGVIIASLGNPAMLATVGLGVAVANSVSNACGGYISEKTERIHRHNKFERALLIKRGIAKTVQMTTAEKESLKMGLSDSLGTFLGAMVPLLSVLFIPSPYGIIIGTVVPVAFYIGLGIYLGLMSGEHLVISAIKITIFAIGTVVLSHMIRIWFT